MIKPMLSVNITRTVDTMEIIGTMVCGSVIGASIWILIFCLLWVIYSCFGESMNSSDMNSLDPSDPSTHEFIVFVNAVGEESGRCIHVKMIHEDDSRQDV